MRAWAILQHVPYEGPGLIAALARERGLAVEQRHLYRGESVPVVEELAGLVVLGGPMGVADLAAHPHLSAEIELLAAASAGGLPVLGVCLGAQLLAAALGGEVFRGEQPEIGPGHVTLSDAGEEDPVLGPAGPSLPVLHWHQDTFTLPPAAELLASSDSYVNQAFRRGNAYGLQFHVELDVELARAMRPHLPEDAICSDEQVARIAAGGREILARFFAGA
jgi:GMP synthase (glutamine-hydrolysing)